VLGLAPDAVVSLFNPTPLHARTFSGLIGMIVFALALMEIKANLRSRSRQHATAVTTFFRIKNDLGALLAEPSSVTDEEWKSAKERYAAAGEFVTPIPESKFLLLKRKHLLKVAASKYLDGHPGASVRLFYLRMWCRDNLRRL
jgi:hypothetical protein